uniref:hypothetical protein n=1 Tax=Mycobacterium celatum TaxID=28045 RepID=UPI0015E85973|nr:hypothetical protein [Mycobacterium celatum]
MQLGDLELRAELNAAAEMGVDLVKVCAELDVANVPAAQWEPYRPEGNWRAALDAWYVDAGKRPRRLPQPQTMPGARHTGPRHSRSLIPSRHRAGSSRNTGWRDWLADRLPHWPDKHLADQYRLTLLDPGARPRATHSESALSLIGADRESYHRTAVNLLRLFGYTGPAPLPTLRWCRLPDYWTNAR